EGRYLKTDFLTITDIEPVDGQIAYSSESVAEGRATFEKVCGECHGKQGRGNILSGKKLKADWGYRLWPRDLTKPWTFRANNIGNDGKGDRASLIANIYQRLSIGIAGTPMPAHRAVEEGNKDPIALDMRWHVANYVYSLRENSQQPDEGGTVTALKVDGALPDDADDDLWNNTSRTTLSLVPNIIKDDRLFTPLNDAVTVRTLYNEDEIAFLLEIDDRTDSRPGEKVSEGIQDRELKMFSDAIAIQFPKQEAYEVTPTVEKPLYRHGDKKHGTTIWYWTAGSVMPEKSESAMLLDASGPENKLAPRMDDVSLKANGTWKDGRWQIIMKRPRNGGASGDVNFEEGNFIPISFANWDGSNGEAGSKHTLTTWYWLVLPPVVDNTQVFGPPIGAMLLVFACGLLLVSRARKK
ncbi:MAG: hypothetical protein KAI89_03835, partial [Emcibacter sp.]|nr:hypothetical protein [Emcibacter sp.]